MEWPPQNTGLFAPPACATCCAEVPEAEAGVQGYRMTIGGVVQQLPNLQNAVGLTYSLAITPVERDPETSIVAIGQLTWSYQVFGDLAGTSEECRGCYGYSCVDGDGNPYGGTYGYLPDLVPHVWEFYVISSAEHGRATDLVIVPTFTVPQGLSTNMPDCTEYGSDYVTITQTVTW